MSFWHKKWLARGPKICWVLQILRSQSGRRQRLEEKHFWRQPYEVCKWLCFALWYIKPKLQKTKKKKIKELQIISSHSATIFVLFYLYIHGILNSNPTVPCLLYYTFIIMIFLEKEKNILIRYTLWDFSVILHFIGGYVTLYMKM